MNKYSQEIKNTIREEYIGGQSISGLATKYNIPYATIKTWVKELPRNGTSRFYQRYEIKEDFAEIYIRSKGSYVIALIDIEDVDKCKNLGIWSLAKNGYISNCKTGIYLHRFVMNCPDNLEVDHIYHNLLDNRKSKLRISTSSEQKMNTKIRKDNTSGHRGVWFDTSRQKWCARVQNKNKRVMKRFDELEDAIAFCEEKRKELHQEFIYKECDA